MAAGSCAFPQAAVFALQSCFTQLAPAYRLQSEPLDAWFYLQQMSCGTGVRVVTTVVSSMGGSVMLFLHGVMMTDGDDEGDDDNGIVHGCLFRLDG